MRLHVGSGSVYLREWVNVDLPLPHVFLAKERLSLLEKFATTEDAYYARHENKTIESWRRGPIQQETVCDVYGSFGFLPARDGSVTEILSRQTFEHLNVEQAQVALREAVRVMKKGAVLRLDVPDPEETLSLYRKTGDEFYVRHLFGPRRDEFGFHTHYTRSSLSALASQAGLGYAGEEPNIHPYPAFCFRFTRI